MTIFLSTETIIYHNFSNNTDAGSCEPQRCAAHYVTYDVSMERIIALIEQSTECRQFIKVFLNLIKKFLEYFRKIL